MSVTNRTKLFYWIYPPYLATALVCALAFTAFTSSRASDFFFELTSLELHETAKLAANAFEPLLASGSPKESLGALASALTNNTQIRLTVIDPDGLVLADTVADPSVMDLHLDRAEIRRAFSQWSGSAVRTSVSTGITTTYEAVALRRADGSPLAIVRASMPFSILGTRKNELALHVFLFGLVILALVSVIAGLLAHRLVQPILRIHSGARLFAQGRLKDKIPETGPREVASLAAMMNKMAEDLDSRIRIVASQQAELASILNGIPEAVAVIGPALDVLACNPAFRKMFQLPALPPETGSPSWGALIALTRSAELSDFMAAALHAEGPLEAGITRYAPEARQLRLISSPMGQGKSVLVISDLTHLNRLETVRRDFTTNVSHELRTPITSIKAALETLQDSGFDDAERARNFLTMALRGTGRLEAILSDLFSLARIEEDESHGIETEAVDMDALIDGVVGEVRSAVPDSVVIERDPDCESGLVVPAHPGLLRQALSNLLENASKYASSGGPVSVSVYAEDGNAVLSVADKGPGIPARDRERIFERFYRIDRARSRDTGGTGLGLAIVKHIARAHSGFVTLDSEEGSGSIFRIHIPLVRLQR